VRQAWRYRAGYAVNVEEVSCEELRGVTVA
jgi:hypothetical protein